MQGLGTGSISLFGSPELKARYLPPVRDGEAIAAFALSEPEAGSDVAALATTATPDGAVARPPRRRQDLDLERRHRRSLRRLRAQRRRRPAPRVSRPSWSTPRRPGLTVAERIEVIAPHPLATLRFDGVRVPLAQPPRQAGRRLQGRDGDARRLPLDGRRRRARLRAPRAGRGARARRDPQAVRRAARRSAADAGRHRRQRDRGRRLRAAGLPRRLDQGSAARRASPARRRWRRCSRPKRRSA